MEEPIQPTEPFKAEPPKETPKNIYILAILLMFICFLGVSFYAGYLEYNQGKVILKCNEFWVDQIHEKYGGEELVEDFIIDAGMENIKSNP